MAATTGPASIDDDVDFKYWAFISYSHQDEAWATWIHRSLEGYRLPRGVAGSDFRGEKVPKHLRPVFRDRDELAGGADLGGKLRRSLRDSRTLIVICSEKSAGSKWVNEEVRYFKSLGREDRVLCLIVSGEPYACGTPGAEHKECFPKSIRFQLDGEGEISSEPAEPLAADVRPGKDGKPDALLKLVAGVLDIGFDRLKQRDARRRKMRRIQWYAGSACGLIFGAAGYLLLADQGVGLPGKETIQLELDRRELSVMRAVASDEEIFSTAKRLRLDLSNAIHRAKEDSGWISQTLRDGEDDDLPDDPFSHSQAMAALCVAPERGPWSDDLLLKCARMTFVPEPGKSISGFQELYAPPEPSLKPFDSCGAFWFVNLLAASTRKEGLVPGSMRPALAEDLLEVQQALEPYRAGTGGWWMFPGADQTAPPNAYSASLALLALLECRKAGLPWMGSVERRDELLEATALWLRENFHQDGKAAGWRGTGENRYEIFDGLTLQIHATLLRAKNEAGIGIPDHILQAMERQLIDCASRTAAFPVASGEFESDIKVQGRAIQRKEAYRFLWYPWALVAMDGWLKMEKAEPRPKEQVVRIRRARAHLVMDIGPVLVDSLENNWLFMAAETLYGLSSVRED
ncbi:toll/interleukin-1 receptor domain-containing protein [Luteolibacter sp. SL250]|uniref:toll/interleukin-1 receptor domain-containing protein n=1 Tax=Luteolibacter sp. SL250 TaxID=2995170 RepID=UPI0022705D8E|nr:toll/interleukin-1 receptor domain-containing protein [Luteolibacter sp. SL250]WAC18399.1 toll/interleukin-1 receptor domain-containing protein [Luteolibacter sp. SL250]